MGVSTAAVRPPHPVCPSCLRTLRLGTRVCVACGIDIMSGRPILTAQRVDRDTLRARATPLIRLLSLLVPIGIYPVASEAFGTRKPYAIWAIAVATVLASFGFWAAQDGGGVGGDRGWRDLMLWAGTKEPVPATIDTWYRDTAWGDTRAYRAQRERLRYSVPADRLTLAAHEALPRAERATGEFHAHQLVTHALLHADPWHLAGNLLFLLIFGTRVNALIGDWRTLALYPALAALAAGGHALLARGQPLTPLLGASGAIMGLAGVYLVLFPVHRVFMTLWVGWWWLPVFALFAVRGFWVLLFYIAFDVAATLRGARDGVAHTAHLGGFLAGVAIALALLLSRRVNSRGGDLLSVLLGKHAWPLLGKPSQWESPSPGSAVAAALATHAL